MNTQKIYVNILSSVNVLSGNVDHPQIINGDLIAVKGIATITYILTGVSETPFPVTRIHCIFNDINSGELIKYRTLNSLSSDILTQFNYVYYPAGSSYYYTLTSQLDFYLDTGSKITFLQPIKIAQSSMYDEIDDLIIVNSQGLDSNVRHNLVNFSSDKNKHTIIGVLSS